MAHDNIRSALAAVLDDMDVDDVQIRLDRPRDPSHGDVATNVAMALAGRLRRPPRDVATEIVERLDLYAAGVKTATIAGPGFINFTLASGDLASGLGTILRQGDDYGRSDEGQDQAIAVEFVSANPTGPLHLGHGRQAALGDAISSLLEWTGWKVHREFYYNDAGVQIERLSRSLLARYRQALGMDAEVPEDGYHGEYVVDLAQQLVDLEGDRYASGEEAQALDAMRRFAVQMLRDEQDRDLGDFRVHFDEHYLESSLYEDGRVEQTKDALIETGLTYEKDGALWFRSTEFGDQKDRVMVKSDGNATYFLPDVAYHLTKWERGFHHAINVQGADHHGTVARVRAGCHALGLPEGYPEYVLHQMVTVERDGKEVKASKRAGSYTTLRELYEDVGVDVVRYFFQMRRPEAHLVFDLDMALDQSEKNPVYKVQYAHARMCSIFRKAELDPTSVDQAKPDYALLEDPLERELIKELAEFPAVVTRAAQGRTPQPISDYLERTAGRVNSWYHAGNPTRNPELAVLADDPDLRLARLCLARSVQIVLRNGLTLLGITAPERMERTQTEDG